MIRERMRVEGAEHGLTRQDALGMTRAFSAEAAHYPVVLNDSTT